MVTYSVSKSHSVSQTIDITLTNFKTALTHRPQLEGGVLEDGGLLSENSTFSQDELAQDCVILVSAYIKASAETESLTTPSIRFFFWAKASSTYDKWADLLL